VRNITDPDSRLMHCTLRGLVQAYNCQVPRTADGVFLLPRATQDVNDAASSPPRWPPQQGFTGIHPSQPSPHL
jgi:hypothetical protein